MFTLHFNRRKTIEQCPWNIQSMLATMDHTGFAQMNIFTFAVRWHCNQLCSGVRQAMKFISSFAMWHSSKVLPCPISLEPLILESLNLGCRYLIKIFPIFVIQKGLGQFKSVVPESCKNVVGTTSYPQRIQQMLSIYEQAGRLKVFSVLL